jgi:hypothetical protein
VQLKQLLKKLEEEEGTGGREKETSKSAVKAKALAKYVAEAESLKLWAESMSAELEEANRTIESDFTSSPDSPTPTAILLVEAVRRAREEFRDQEKVINESKAKKKNQTEDLYIDMKKTGCSDPASCPFSLVEECVNRLEGVLFERRRKLDDRLRRAEADAEREREQISDQQAEAEHDKRRRAQLDTEREKLEREKKLMESELRERARLLKQELQKLKGDGTASSNTSPRGVVSPRSSARSEPPSTRADPPAAAPKPETSWEKTTPDPRKILNAECTSGSSTLFARLTGVPVSRAFPP